MCVSRNPDNPFLQQNRESILLLWNFSPTLTSFNFVHLKVGQCPYFSSQRSVTKEAQLKSLCESKTIITIITIITTITTMEKERGSSPLSHILQTHAEVDNTHVSRLVEDRFQNESGGNICEFERDNQNNQSTFGSCMRR